MKKKVYIYGLRDPRDGKLRYIGKSANPRRRIVHHVSLSRHRRLDYPVNRWIRKLLKEEERPDLEILEEVSQENWREAERDWIKKFRKRGARLLNIAPGGNGAPAGTLPPNTGRHLTIEHRRAISRSGKGRRRSLETRRRMSEAQRELYADPAERAKQSERLLGHSVTRETRRKLRQANLGKTHSEETRQKISGVTRGRKLTNEHRQKISQALKGKPKSEKHRKHLSEATKGKPTGPCSESRAQNISKALKQLYLNPAQRKKRSEAVKRGWETRRRNAQCQQ